jgi:hypothetical protein
MIGEWWIGKDLEGSGGGLDKVLSRNLPEGAEEEHDKSTSGLGADIWTQDLPNTKQEC